MRDWQADVNAIRRILLTEWDPIGCGVPDDEYDGYIPAIYQLMRNGASAGEISQRLCQIETSDMGMADAGAMAERNYRVAVLLLEVMNQE